MFPRGTVKRRLFHAGVKGLTMLGLDTRWASARDADADLLSAGERELLLEELRRAGVTVAEWLLAWPARPERRRQYLVFRDAITRRLGVAKIGAGGFNRRQFQNETEMLRRLAPEPADGLRDGRPTKRDRRSMDQLRGGWGDRWSASLDDDGLGS